MIQEITIPTPDDFHLHLRDGTMLTTVLPHTATVFARATVMPNLQPPITNAEQAQAYAKRIAEALPEGVAFSPIIPLYLTETTTAEEIHRAVDTGLTRAMKYYPAGATTNSDGGVNNIARVEKAITAMIDRNIPLLIHGEVTDPSVDFYDREARFIDEILIPLRTTFPELKVVMEHISTKEAVQYVSESSDTLAASITAHHIHLNRNALFQGGMNPHHFCFPIIKGEEHRKAVLAAAVSGKSKFFLGTDSAPHLKSAKESAHGSAGLYSAFSALPLYAEAFEAEGALDLLGNFASKWGADFYGIPQNSGTITLKKEPLDIPESFPVGDDSIVPFRAGGTVSWRVVSRSE